MLLDKCENHSEDKIAKYFCKSCNMSICLNCRLAYHINHLTNNSKLSEEDNNISIFDYPEIYDLENTQTTSLSDSFISEANYSIISLNLFREIFQADKKEITSRSFDKVDISIFNGEKAEINHANEKNKYLWIYCLLLLPNGHVVSSSNSNNILISDPGNKFKTIKEIKGLKYPVYSVALISNEVFATGSMQTIKFWVISKDYQCIGNLPKAHDSNIYSLLLLSNGNLVSASDKLIQIWDKHSDYFNNLASLKGHKEDINCLVQLFNGKLVSASSDKTIRIWLVKKKYKCIKKLNAHEGVVKTLLTTSNGNLLSGSYDKTVKIWDCRMDYNLISTIIGHDNAICSLLLLPDDRIVTGSYDKTIRIWDLKSDGYKCIKTLKEKVTAMVFLENGHLVSSSWNNGLRLWKCN
jgi:WD40 repeat protein